MPVLPKGLERNFTRFHGDEVEVLIERIVPWRSPDTPAEVPAFPPRTNAPGEIQPTQADAKEQRALRPTTKQRTERTWKA